MAEPELTRQRIQAVVEALPRLVGRDLTPNRLLPEQDSLAAGILPDYYRLVEIAHFVRRGGVHAMLYRLETGKTAFVPVDYFDEAHERLTAAYRNLYSPLQATEVPLLDRLRQITDAEEQAVREVLPELDSLLLQDRRTEAVLADEQ